MSLAEKLNYSIDDVLNLPEGERAELIDGQLYMMSAPGRIHQKLSGFLHTEIADYIKKKSGDCEVYAAPFAVFLFADDTTYVEPDISVICQKEKLTDQGCNGAPDFIIEIVSPSSQQRDYQTKLFLYRNAGVRLYWIVDPENMRIIEYFFPENTFAIYTFSDIVPVKIYEDCTIDFSSFSF